MDLVSPSPLNLIYADGAIKVHVLIDVVSVAGLRSPPLPPVGIVTPGTPCGVCDPCEYNKLFNPYMYIDSNTTPDTADLFQPIIPCALGTWKFQFLSCI